MKCKFTKDKKSVTDSCLLHRVSQQAFSPSSVVATEKGGGEYSLPKDILAMLHSSESESIEEETDELSEEALDMVAGGLARSMVWT